MHKKTIFQSKGWTDMYSKQPAPSHGPPYAGNSASISPPCDQLPVQLPPESACSCQTNSLSHFMPNTCCIRKSNIITLLLFIDLNISMYNA